MITFLETSVFDSPAQTLVNTVNTVGVMGKGIAKEFKSRYPAMYSEYRLLCDEHQLGIGGLHMWRGDKRWVLNFPTKTTWRLPSKIEYVKLGLEKFVESYARLGITSISFPPLGCGNGNLDWKDVRPVMESYLKRVTIQVYIHDVQVREGFVAEHLEDGAAAPEDFVSFWNDLSKVIKSNKGVFFTLSDGRYAVEEFDEGEIVVNKDGRRRRIDRQLVEESWTSLREQCLTNQSFPDENTRRLKSYLFPIIAELPYVRRAPARTGEFAAAKSEALFISRDSFRGYDAKGESSRDQGWLSL